MELKDRPSDSGAKSALKRVIDAHSEERKRKTKAQLMQERSTERQWGRKCTQKSDRRMRYMQKNGNVKRKLNWSMRDLRGKLRKHMLKHNWIPSDTGPGGNRTPDRPWPTVLHLLTGTLTGEKRIFPKNFFGKINFPKIVIKFRPPRTGLRKHKLSLYSRRLSLYSPIFPKKVANFWENWSRETARTRSASDKIVILVVIFIIL